MPHSRIVTIDDPTLPSRQHEVNNIKDHGFSGRTVVALARDEPKRPLRVKVNPSSAARAAMATSEGTDSLPRRALQVAALRHETVAFQRRACGFDQFSLQPLAGVQKRRGD